MRAVKALGGQQDAFGGVGCVEEFPRRGTVSPDHDFAGAAIDGVNAFLDQGGDHVGGSWVKVVAGPVKVDGQEADGVEPVLLPVRLPLDEQHLLGQAVRRIGLLGVAAPQIFFAERKRGKFGIGADGTDADELTHAVPAGGFHQLHAHDGVVVEELARLVPVVTDAAHIAGEMDDDQLFRPGARRQVGKQPLDRLPLAQVIFLAARDEDLPIVHAARVQFGDDVLSKKAGAAGEDDRLRRPVKLWPSLGHKQNLLAFTVQPSAIYTSAERLVPFFC